MAVKKSQIDLLFNYLVRNDVMNLKNSIAETDQYFRA
jgi:hypothetical protein